MKQETLSAGRWTTLSALTRSGLQLLQIVILARLVAPAEFGLMAITTAWLAILTLVADFGFSRALIHFKDTPAPIRSSLFWINMLLAATLMLAVMAISPWIASFYRAPELCAVLGLATLSLPLAACGQQLRTLAEKNLQFRQLARSEIVAASLSFIVAVAMGWQGYGAFALVGGLLANNAANSALAWLQLDKQYRPAWRLRFGETRPYLKFGGYMIGDGLTNTLHQQADIFIGGALASPAALGMYHLPRDLSLRIANTIVNPVITRISFPMLARAQDDKQLLQETYLQALRVATSINFPIYMALSIFSHEIVAILYGSEWRQAGDYLQILALWGLIRSTGNPSGSLVYAVGRARLAFWWNMLQLIVMPPALWIGGQSGGLTGMAWSMVALQLAILPTGWLVLIKPCCGASLRSYFGALLPAMGCSLVAALTGWAVAQWTDAVLLRLFTGTLSGAAIYCLLSLKFNRLWMDTLGNLLNINRGKQRTW